jgi:hypothetical protein
MSPAARRRTTFAALVALVAVFATPSAGAHPTEPTLAPASGGFAVRGIYERDFSRTGFDHEAAIGLNYIDSGPYRDQMDALARRGLKGFIWLGGYSNDTCSFRRSESWVRSHVEDIAGHSAVGAYFVDDEPNAASCPNAPAQMEARSDLLKSIDPGATTFIVVYRVEQLKLFAGATDVIGLDDYPCKLKLHGCDYSVIEEQADEADRLGIRYWGVIQAWGDDYYKLPTPAELREQFVQWRGTNMEGYLVFAWNYPDDMPRLWLAKHPRLQAQISIENGTWPATRIAAGPPATTTSRQATFRFTTATRGATFWCRLDSRVWRPCSSPTTYHSLSPGEHVFRVRARDAAGRFDPTPATRRWRIV